MAPVLGAERAALVERARLCGEELAQMSRDTVRVSAERRAVIRRLLDLGMSRTDVADALGVSRPRVHYLVHGRASEGEGCAAMQNGPGP